MFHLGYSLFSPIVRWMISSLRKILVIKQVRLFLPEDCPSKVGLQAQDRLQAKTWVSCLKNVYSDNHYSRSEGRHTMDPLKEKLSRIAQIKWTCPPNFVLSYNWHVAAGEESEEAETQRNREMRLLEAVYPRLSDIPPSPSVPLDLQQYLDDSRIPLISITPIEEGAVDLPSDTAAPQNALFDSQSQAQPLDLQEYHLDDSHSPGIPIAPIVEEGTVDLPSDMASQQNASFDLQSQALPQRELSANPNAPQCVPQASLNTSANEKPTPEVLPGFQADVGVVVVAAITAMIKSKEQGSLIDTDLLIKLLSDPNMIEKLTSQQAAPANTKADPVTGSKPSTASMPLPSSKPSLVAEVINEDEALAKTGSTSISVSIPGPKPDPVIKRLTDEVVAPTDTRAPPISVSKLVTESMALPNPRNEPVIENFIQQHRALTDPGAAPLCGSTPVTPSVALPSPVIEKLIQKYAAPTDTAVAHVSGPKPATSTFPSPISAPVVATMIHEHGVPTNAGSTLFSVGNLAPPTASLPGLKQGAVDSAQELVRIKRIIDEYGALDPMGNKPISRPMPLSPQVHFSNPNPGVLLPARMNSHLLPNRGRTGLQMRALSPDHKRPNSITLPYFVQPRFQVKELSPDSVPLSSISAATAPPAKDINYIRSLIRQHGDMQVTKGYNLSPSGNIDVCLQDPKLVPNLKPTELTPHVQILQRPCVYFNSPKGCRNGSNCLYRHDMSKRLQPGSVFEAPSSKRMKLDGEIAGRT